MCKDHFCRENPSCIEYHNILIASILCFLAIAVQGRYCPAEVIRVPGDYPTIQRAVYEAEDGDEILVAPGTYTGEGECVVDLLGKAVWLHSSHGSQVTFIDGEYVRRGVVCQSMEDSNTIIEGFNITQCYSSEFGGGMMVLEASPTISNCLYYNNYAHAGGGMYNTSSGAILNRCTFIDNTAIYGGGGMYNYRSENIVISCCLFDDNIVLDHLSYGGGMYNSESTVIIHDSLFRGNTVPQNNSGGGGMFNYDSTSIMTGCGFISNTADEWGGAMYNNESILTLADCLFLDNEARDGSGIYSHSNSELIVSHSVFRGNSALFGLGGGLVCHDCTLTLSDCVFDSNVADRGGGIYQSDGQSTLSYCLFSNNIADYGGGMNSKANETVITGCAFLNNSDYGISNCSSDATLIQCTFKYNANGGMHNMRCNPLLENVCFLVMRGTREVVSIIGKVVLISLNVCLRAMLYQNPGEGCITITRVTLH